MTKKILSAVLCILIFAAFTLGLAGCSADSDNFPVTVGHTEIKEKPENLVVLSDNIADIILRLGYSTQIVGVSDACTQSTLTRYVDSVGSETDPDLSAIKKTGAKYVLTDTKLSEKASSGLAEMGVEVITMITPKNPQQLKALYEGIGKLTAGKTDGFNMGKTQYDTLVSELEQTENQVNNNSVIKLFCYLYIDENGNLCSFDTNTQEGLLLEYVGATNACANFTDGKVDQNILKLSNPEYIFCDSEQVLDYVKSSPVLKELSAVKKGNTYMLPLSALERQGNTMLETQKFIMSKIYPDIIKQEATGESLAARYSIELKENMKFEVESESEEVKAIQQRLIDLGYLVLSEGDGATTYYGEKTADAVKAFQKAQSLEENGIADYSTLQTLFLSTTPSVSGEPYIPSSISTEEKPTETTAEATKPANAGNGITPSGYSITFSESTAYKFNDKSEDIKAIQQRLEELQYLTFGDGDTYTTLYGPGTERAITQFQEDNGLEATGVADYKTLKALFGV